jgi:hypothetical protein
LRDVWLERAERDFKVVDCIAEAPGCPKAAVVTRHLQRLLDAAADCDCLTLEDREQIIERARATARIAYQRFFENLFERGQAVMRGESNARLEPLLATAKELMQTLHHLQLDATSEAGLKEKIAILLETSKPGDSSGSKPAWQPTVPLPFAEDKRLFVRYRDPVLQVQIGDHRYRTPSWGLGGLMLAGVADNPGAPGSLVEIRFCIENGQVYSERAGVVWYDPAERRMGLQLRRFGSAMVTLKKECEAKGLSPHT